MRQGEEEDEDGEGAGAVGEGEASEEARVPAAPTSANAAPSAAATGKES